MTESPRLIALKQMLAADPANSFARYGLAMEQVNSGNLALAVAEFETLLSNDQHYSAAYFHGGQTLEKMGDAARAKDFYQRGLENTRDAHARAEMQAALDMLP